MANNGAAALNNGAVSSGNAGAMRSRHTAATVDGCATAQRRTFMTKDVAVAARARSGSHGAAARSSDPGTAASLAAQTSTSLSTQTNAGRRLRRHVTAAQRGAVATKDDAAAFAADPQSGTAGRTNASLTTDADTAQWAGHVRSSRTVEYSAFAGDQTCLPSAAGTKSCVGSSTAARTTCQASQPTTSSTGLATQPTAAGQAPADA